jgi:CTP synthase
MKSRTAKTRRPARISKQNHKYIFVIGGVMSGVGKGVATSSIGTLFSAQGFSVNLVKVDPYLNVDAGTMNPTEHGEVFVLDSGLETDQDMGNYERFLNRDATAADYMTSGMVYKSVIDRERSLGYGGKCVEAVPHIRDEIVHRFEHAAKISKSDISIIEIGGTVGDYQNVMFIEAARFLKIRHPDDVIFIMVSYLPVPSKLGEMKTRPTQHAVHQLASYGVNTDIIVARADRPLDARRKEKIAVACNILPDHVISAPDIESIYDVPVNFDHDGLGQIVMNSLKLEKNALVKAVKRNNAKNPTGKMTKISGKKDRFTDFLEWKKMAREIKDHSDHPVRIAIVGKYFATGEFILTDAYLSVLEAIKFSAREAGVKAMIEAVNATEFEEVESQKPIKSMKPDSKGIDGRIDYSKLDSFDGIIVPGGFGSTGIEGKLNVIKYAREHQIPYFGLCYGMQLMTVEYARHKLGLGDANTTEIDPKTKNPVIDIMLDQKKKMEDKNYGGSMRLGSYPAMLVPGTIAYEAYSEAKSKIESAESKAEGKIKNKSQRPITIKERHRHRFEVNPRYIEKLEKGGLVFSGKSPDGTLMEIAELPRSVHPFFLGTQFHPEFLARPLMPHPLFTEFMKAAKAKKEKGKKEGMEKIKKEKEGSEGREEETEKKAL